METMFEFTDMVTTNGTMTTTALTFNTLSATPCGFKKSIAKAGQEFGSFRLYGAVTTIGAMTVLFAEF